MMKIQMTALEAALMAGAFAICGGIMGAILDHQQPTETYQVVSQMEYRCDGLKAPVFTQTALEMPQWEGCTRVR